MRQKIALTPHEYFGVELFFKSGLLMASRVQIELNFSFKKFFAQKSGSA